MRSFLPSSFLSIFFSRDLGERDDAVDALRGLAIAGMILVNHRPPVPEVYSFMKHAPLVGWTIADAIFPVFLFLVGVSIAYSAAGQPKEQSVVPYSRIVRRTLLLILISIALVNFPYYDLDNTVIHGTLTRIAYCYFFVAIASYHSSWRVQVALVTVILATQWWFLMKYHVPGFGPGVISIQGNASGYIDNLIFGDSVKRLILNGPVIQGLLPSASAIATTLIGRLAGSWILSCTNSTTRDATMLGIGVFAFVAGSLWGIVYPVSKPLWTGSYVVTMSGLTLILLSLFHLAFRYRKFGILGMSLIVAGTNALFFYIFAQSFQRVLVYARLEQSDGTSIRLRYYIYENWVEPWAAGKGGALIYALVFLAVCYGVVFVLYRKRLFFKL